MTKYYLEKRSLGKNYYFLVHTATGKKLKELEDSGEKLFNSRKEALTYATNLKKGC